MGDSENSAASRRSFSSADQVTGSNDTIDPRPSLDLLGDDGKPERFLQRPGDRTAHSVLLPVAGG
jgi:hypothetical protein